jgi:mono/diheme cytochrome c family protein
LFEAKYIMSKKHRVSLAALFIAASAIGITACDKAGGNKPVSFVTEIKPLLEARCVNCHQAGALFGELNLENRELAFKPRAKGPVITPGDPDKSTLYLVLTLPEGDRTAMPPTGHRISPEETALIKRWIQQGATWPTGPDGVVKAIVTRDPKGV